MPFNLYLYIKAIKPNSFAVWILWFVKYIAINLNVVIFATGYQSVEYLKT